MKIGKLNCLLIMTLLMLLCTGCNINNKDKVYIDGQYLKIELPNGFYGGDIYGFYKYPNGIGHEGVRIGYTYEQEIMKIDEVKIKIHYGFLVDKMMEYYRSYPDRGKNTTFKCQINLYPNIGKFRGLEQTEATDVNYYTIKEFNVDFSNIDDLNNYMCTSEVIDAKKGAYHFSYLDSCIFEYQIMEEMLLNANGTFSIGLAVFDNNYKSHLDFYYSIAQFNYEKVSDGIKVIEIKNDYLPLN